MTSKIKVHDKEFEIFIDQETILDRVAELANQINKDYKNREVLFLSILNGSFFFTSDLLKKIKLPCEVSFVKLASYQGLKSSGKIKVLIGLMKSLKDKHVVILEDIVDSGKTMTQMLSSLSEHEPESIKIATLLFKKEALVEDIKPDYVGFEVPDKFLVGYGLDYNEHGRNHPALYTLIG
ncbi:MAG: hypoxanthine phosphoribosyltransferase [Bacteroidetes bacterium]|jgi:hypoxanthine phosphoribosyltransferase|nr:hypoxanthine phosphoribosyltransferase [Bacteroidota bacterium]MBT5530391.1 hypoxanthine phosphoribosyltransferase [Cytophagia bacterium]MBT3424244.1 hypoxanthine phosphoribosyltransferase [Bacteroidota bacterium]MBT3801857.1 hypoxanthine phosphoribosyltransferase [Bacteroidota bacterium]MBT3935682.1 hypoxanthine phosphoribosyltransferase [Bacteroidota bacterium]